MRRKVGSWGSAGGASNRGAVEIQADDGVKGAKIKIQTRAAAG